MSSLVFLGAYSLAGCLHLSLLNWNNRFLLVFGFKLHSMLSPEAVCGGLLAGNRKVCREKCGHYVRAELRNLFLCCTCRAWRVLWTQMWFELLSVKRTSPVKERLSFSDWILISFAFIQGIFKLIFIIPVLLLQTNDWGSFFTFFQLGMFDWR